MYRGLTTFIRKWEGGFVNDPLDRGGATNMGITIGTWKTYGYDKDKDGDIDVADLKRMSIEDWDNIFKRQYWDRWKADQIKHKEVAYMLVDWVWCSGVYGVKIPQRVLGVTTDGFVGNNTLIALNNKGKDFARELGRQRIAYLYRITNSDKTQKKYINGWCNRVNDLLMICGYDPVRFDEIKELI